MATTGLSAAGQDLRSAADAIDVFDFEAAAERLLPPAHWGYLATGVDGDATLRANRDGFSRFLIRARRVIDVARVDQAVSLFGATWPTPIGLAPIGSQRAFHADGEMAVARAAKSRETLFVLSTTGTASIEEVTAAAGGPGRVWFQLYPTSEWTVGLAMTRRAERAGCPVLVLTVDLQGGGTRATQTRHQRRDTTDCTPCHPGGGFADRVRRKPMFDGLDLSSVRGYHPAVLDWSFVKRLKDSTSMKLVLKGVVTREDAALAVEHGVDGLIVSNHGGRAEESGRGAIESLPEVVEAVAGRVPVLIDGGFRRGADIFKALALGANAVMIGRPYVWGLACFGQTGVEAVLDILRRELATAMRQAGTTAVSRITSASVMERTR
jgi:isopentenyl diphosphate isomerase/L-lactate dehydrogenase-like FMN-dependent dehydrogenase